MTPKDKAKELINTMYLRINFYITAKKCALIAVDEILIECRLARDWYWEEVKQEIQKL